jgi:tetratricopeptide (TPR) repeat protein
MKRRRIFPLLVFWLLSLYSPRLWAKGPAYTYQVSADITTLSEISLFLYGKVRFQRKIATWNNLKPPFAVSSGQVLVLLQKPTLTPEQGSQLLLEMWRKRLGLTGPTEVPRNAEDFFTEGEKLFEKGEYRKAAELFEKSIRMDPGHVPGWFYLIRALKVLGEKEEESRQTRRFLSRFPNLVALPMFQGAREGDTP